MTEVFRINSADSAALEDERDRAWDLITTIVHADWVHEVGSTAVEGVIGKQDLDFLVRVPASEFETTRYALDQYFSRNPDQLSNNQYQGYVVDSEFDVAIQLTVDGGQHDTFLTFLEELRASPKLRARYNQLKRTFDGRPMTEYREAKRNFIEKALGLQ